MFEQVFTWPSLKNETNPLRNLQLSRLPLSLNLPNRLTSPIKKSRLALRYTTLREEDLKFNSVDV